MVFSRVALLLQEESQAKIEFVLAAQLLSFNFAGGRANAHRETEAALDSEAPYMRLTGTHNRA